MMIKEASTDVIYHTHPTKNLRDKFPSTNAKYIYNPNGAVAHM
jgi:hypothetical protein